LYGTVAVVATMPSGTPAESGCPNVMAPLPAFTRSASEWPWYAPSNFTITLRRVKPRATRSALMVASVPLETQRNISMLG
jgi:hypothetical protein